MSNGETANTFGAFIKDRRITNTGMSLREFCLANGIDPGNFSKLERGMMEPPNGEETLARYAEALKIERNSDDWFRLFDLAAAERGRIPHDLLNDSELVGKLPAVFRTLRQRRVDDDDLEELAQLIRRS